MWGYFISHEMRIPSLNNQQFNGNQVVFFGGSHVIPGPLMSKSLRPSTEEAEGFGAEKKGPGIKTRRLVRKAHMLW